MGSGRSIIVHACLGNIASLPAEQMNIMGFLGELECGLEAEMTHEGGCLCGAIRFRANAGVIPPKNHSSHK